jgi:hypothetical protein
MANIDADPVPQFGSLDHSALAADQASIHDLGSNMSGDAIQEVGSVPVEGVADGVVLSETAGLPDVPADPLQKPTPETPQVRQPESLPEMIGRFVMHARQAGGRIERGEQISIGPVIQETMGIDAEQWLNLRRGLTAKGIVSFEKVTQASRRITAAVLNETAAAAFVAQLERRRTMPATTEEESPRQRNESERVMHIVFKLDELKFSRTIGVPTFAKLPKIDKLLIAAGQARESTYGFLDTPEKLRTFLLNMVSKGLDDKEKQQIEKAGLKELIDEGIADGLLMKAKLGPQLTRAGMARLTVDTEKIRNSLAR